MYRSMKKQNRFHLPGQRRTVCAVPLKSGREESLPSTDEAELNAISNAMRKGQPLYFIRTDDGITMDVVLDKKSALRYVDSNRERMWRARPRIRIYERMHTALIPIA